jgi:hypothetical protein
MRGQRWQHAKTQPFDPPAAAAIAVKIINCCSDAVLSTSGVK